MGLINNEDKGILEFVICYKYRPGSTNEYEFEIVCAKQLSTPIHLCYNLIVIYTDI